MSDVLPIVRALLYLRMCTLRNLLLSQMKRLREPRYLLGLVIAIGYLWLLAFGRSPTPGRGMEAMRASLVGGDTLSLLAASVATLFVLAQWILPGERPGLKFSEAEVAFLFPAPLPRRHLLHYKLLHNLFATLLGALFFTLLTVGANKGVLPALRYLTGWWLLTTNITLHGMAAALTLNRFTGAGARKHLRRLCFTLLALAFIGAQAWLMLNGKREWLEMLLAPGRVLVGPLINSDKPYWLSVLPLLALVVLHYGWVLKMEAPFEEASLEESVRHAELINRLRSGKGIRLVGQERARRQPFQLRPWMPVELVLYWKNVMLAPPYLNRRLFALAVALISVGMWYLHEHASGLLAKLPAAIGGLGFVLTAYLVMFGPVMARIDLRAELQAADQLRSWPWPGWRLALGSLLAPVVLLTGVGWVLLLCGTLGMAVWPDAPRGISAGDWLQIGGAMALLLPLVFALQLLMPNAMALWFPTLLQGPRVNQRGIEMAGLQMVLMVGQFIVLAAALLPVLLVAGVVMFISQWFGDAALALLWALGAVLVTLMLEVLYGIYLLGERLERFDLSAEQR